MDSFFSFGIFRSLSNRICRIWISLIYFRLVWDLSLFYLLDLSKSERPSIGYINWAFWILKNPILWLVISKKKKEKKQSIAYFILHKGRSCYKARLNFWPLLTYWPWGLSNRKGLHSGTFLLCWIQQSYWPKKKNFQPNTQQPYSTEIENY